MTKTLILDRLIEEHKLIIKFMGYAKDDAGMYTLYAPHPLCRADGIERLGFMEYTDYHANFNYLIPIRNKILSDTHRVECIKMGFDNWMDFDTDIMEEVLESVNDLDTLYSSIIKYIKIFNNSNK